MEQLAEQPDQFVVVIVPAAYGGGEQHPVPAGQPVAVVDLLGLPQGRVERPDLVVDAAADDAHRGEEEGHVTFGADRPVVVLQAPVARDHSVVQQRLGVLDAADRADRRVLGEDPHRGGHRVRRQGQVGVDVADQVAPGVRGAHVAGGTAATVDAGADHVDPEGGGHRDGLVGAAVVDHQQFDVRVGLVEDGPQAQVQRLGVVVVRHDYRDQRTLVHRVATSGRS
ncbi:hypothetical protein GCM10029963_23420 [Micromonospora andamanensis]